MVADEGRRAPPGATEWCRDAEAAHWVSVELRNAEDAREDAFTATTTRRASWRLGGHSQDRRASVRSTRHGDLQQLREYAFFSAKTGLPNDRALDADLSDLDRIARILDEPYALLFADVDRFRRFNRTVGWETSWAAPFLPLIRLPRGLATTQTRHLFGRDAAPGSEYGDRSKRRPREPGSVTMDPMTNAVGET